MYCEQAVVIYLSCQDGASDNLWHCKEGFGLCLVPAANASNWRSEWYKHYDQSDDHGLDMKLIIGHASSIRKRDLDVAARRAKLVAALPSNYEIPLNDPIPTAKMIACPKGNQGRFVVLTTFQSYVSRVERMYHFQAFSSREKNG